MVRFNDDLLARVLILKFKENYLEHKQPKFIKWRKLITKQLNQMAKWE